MVLYYITCMESSHIPIMVLEIWYNNLNIAKLHTVNITDLNEYRLLTALYLFMSLLDAKK
jgi:hypothetical protein